MWSRIHLIPLLTAEEDRDLVRRHYADQAREKELLGSQTSPYNSDRHVVPPRPGLTIWKMDCALANNPQVRTTHIRSHAESEIEIEVEVEDQIEYREGYGYWVRRECCIYCIRIMQQC
jgi:hypothetical protein